MPEEKFWCDYKFSDMKWTIPHVTSVMPEERFWCDYKFSDMKWTIPHVTSVMPEERFLVLLQTFNDVRCTVPCVTMYEL